MTSFDYTGAFAYTLTLNTANAIRAFDEPEFVEQCLRVLAEAGQLQGFEIRAYCFMPDHVHLLVIGSEQSELIPFMKRFKQLTAHWYKHVRGAVLWQRSYYDRVLRREEDIGGAADYIWDNPVRAGVIEDRRDYCWSGPREFMGPDRPEGLSLRSPRPAGASRG